MSGNLKFYYENVTSEVIGSENGITKEQFAELAAAVEPVINRTNKDRNDGVTPYRDLPYIQDNLERVKAISSRIRSQCDSFVVIGTSDGAIECAMACVMPDQSSRPQLSILDNPTPQQLIAALDSLTGRLDRTVFNIAGKSDSPSIEEVLKAISERLELSGLKNPLIITTDAPSGTLDDLAATTGAARLTFTAGIPGLFNILSDAGLLSAAVCGVDIDAILAGARAMDVRTGNEEFARNPAAVYAAIIHHYYNRGNRLSPIIPCSDDLTGLCRWNERLWRQSLDKNIFEPAASDSDAAQSGLADRRTPYIRLALDKLDAYNAGQFIYMMEAAASIAAILFETDTDVASPPRLDKKPLLTTIH